MEILRVWGSYFCHQMCERSLEQSGVFMPLCSRCSAMAISSVVGLVLYFSFVGMKSLKFRTSLLCLVIGVLPNGVDGLTQLVGWRFSNNDLRIVTGILYGLFATHGFMGLLFFYFDKIESRVRIIYYCYPIVGVLLYVSLIFMNEISLIVASYVSAIGLLVCNLLPVIVGILYSFFFFRSLLRKEG